MDYDTDSLFADNELGYEAGIKALLDAHITYDDVELGVACYCYGDSTCGQRVFYQFGMTGIPIYNTNNNCATASTGLVLARNTIAHGGADCVLVVGFEKMKPGSLGSNWEDRTDPIARISAMSDCLSEESKAPRAAQLFASAAKDYMQKYDQPAVFYPPSTLLCFPFPLSPSGSCSHQS